ncbi:hypothetical protein HanXRQr2_Chr07g0293921 [Helianthus annuus]|uniref:Uncharacterized protein n=1 Tax=Helianthus annuus TaxID=4232 RepID=A0A9K3ILD1_HELAN|nr:hypothetical protein HanXRQr2_Chr07g0293921 [Helianthus annuus]
MKDIAVSLTRITLLSILHSIPFHSWPYPVLRILENNALPPVWFPQSPSWKSLNTSSISGSSIHLKYGPARDRLYSILFRIVN